MSRALSLLLTLALAPACSDPPTITSFKRILTTDQATFDAGTVAVNDRETMTVYLASTGRGQVTVYDVYLEEESPDWVILPTWQTEEVTDSDANTYQGTIIDAGEDDNPTYAPVEVSFRPNAEGYYHATLIIESNDSEVVEQNPDNNHAIWKVVLRGVARYPCVSVYPSFYDFGPHPLGAYFDTSATIENCGSVLLTISEVLVDGDPSFSSDTVFPYTVLAGLSGEITLGWEVGSEDGESAVLTPVSNAPDGATSVTLIGNDCTQSLSSGWDEDGDGWMSCGGDCDDDDPAINPQASDGKDDEGDRIDNDCDDQVDEGPGFGADNDGDGVTENDGDCWDNAALVYPGATETFNQVDDDCDGTIDEGTDAFDDDQDGYAERAGDCDDDDAAIYPGAAELYDIIDNDCDGNTDEETTTFDDDEDGYAEYDASGNVSDCDDTDPWSYPGAGEDCDLVDNDCDSLIDEGADDVADGACDFLVDRQVDTATADPAACATAPGAPVTALALLALASAWRRRRAR